MGLVAIPFTSIHDYYKIYDVEQWEGFEEFLYYIRCMDNKFLEIEDKKQKAKDKK